VFTLCVIAFTEPAVISKYIVSIVIHCTHRNHDYRYYTDSEPKGMHLYQPVKIGQLELPNRIVFPAITTLFDTHYDLKGEECSESFYAEIARGGVGLMVIGALQALYPGRRENRVAINDDKYRPELTRWVKAVHRNGSIAAAQLAVWNYWAPGGVGTQPENVSPSGVVTGPPGGFPQGLDPQKLGAISRPLLRDEILQIESEIARAAARAAAIGFDAIEIPAVSGNLFSRFITPFTNLRTDEYGGSLENRLRFLAETIRLVKLKLGEFPIICRIPGIDMMPGGLTLDDSKQIAPQLTQAGVDAISIMPGWYETREPRHQMYVDRGAFVYLAEGIKQVVDIPVCTNMRINSPRLADQIIHEGRADLVAMGRALLADPEMPNKYRLGRERQIRQCVACCVCYEEIAVDRPCCCSVNARLGHEQERTIIPAEHPRRVFIAGAGPAGLEASRVAALRGHKVTLFEKSTELGGQLRVAVLPPHKAEWQSFTDYLVNEINRLGVEVRLQCELTTEIVKLEAPEAVIIAAGATPLTPNIPGIGLDNCVYATDLLAGARPAGQNVVIVGGGLIGCETADLLARAGKQVTVIEMRSEAGLDIGVHNRWLVLERLRRAGVKMISRAKVVAISPQGVEIETEHCRETVPSETVAIAAGMTCRNGTLASDLNKSGIPVYRVGDCVQPDRVRQAVEQGFLAGSSV